MIGLLYKDFVGIKGNRIVLILIIATIVFGVLRFALPGDTQAVAEDAWISNETVVATPGNLADLGLVVVPMMLVVILTTFLPQWLLAICRSDEANKTQQYTRALPLKKNAYIASKYIFLGIAVYVIYSLETIWLIIYNSRAALPNCLDLSTTTASMLPMISAMSLLNAGIELPLFILLGTKKGNLFKIILLNLFAYLVFGFFMFGNLDLLDRFDIVALVDWCQKNTFGITVYSMLLPVICTFLYWVSYRITKTVYSKREVKINE